MRPEVARDWHEADSCLPYIIEILKANAANIIEIVQASPEKDLKEATDLVIRLESGDVACRVRTTKYHFREWTIRYSRPSGIDTEWSKLCAGFARWYFYAWRQHASGFEHWILVDLNKVRADGLFDDSAAWSRPIRNHDGSATFKGCAASLLLERGLLTAYCLPQGRTKPKLSLGITPKGQMTFDV